VTEVSRHPWATMDTTPPSLLQRMRQPDQPEAWAHFVEMYTPYLYLWCRRRGLQESDAADLVQDVLLLVFRKLPEFDYNPRGSFRGWLYTLTLNKMRERHRRRALPQYEMLENLAGPDEIVRQEEIDYRNHLVRHGLHVIKSGIAPKVWQLFEEHVLADRSATDVAIARGLSVGTVYAAKSRVLSRLRQELEGLVEWN